MPSNTSHLKASGSSFEHDPSTCSLNLVLVEPLGLLFAVTVVVFSIFSLCFSTPLDVWIRSSNLWAIARQDTVCFLEINILGWGDCTSGSALLHDNN